MSKDKNKKDISSYFEDSDSDYIIEVSPYSIDEPVYLSNENNDDLLLSENDFRSNEPQYLKSDKNIINSDISCDYIVTENKDQNNNNDFDLLGGKPLRDSFDDPIIVNNNNTPISGGYLRDSTDPLRFSKEIDSSYVKSNKEGLFVQAYGPDKSSYNPYTSEAGCDKSVFGEVGLIDMSNIQSHEMTESFNISDNNDKLSSYSENNNESESSDINNNDNKNNQVISIEKPSKNDSVLGNINNRKWLRCGCPTNWNELFQEILEMDDSTEDLCLEKYRRLSALSTDFVHTAKNFGKIIISEWILQNNHRTLSPYPMGGEAGGEKYVYHGILFKFATDWKGIYKKDKNAMKAAGHELKGVMRYAQCEGLHVPLVALIDYRGYRLVAESILPVHSNSLLYGSNDSGKTVKNENKELSKLMKNAGKQLNIKPHYGGLEFDTSKFIYGPTDIEGHLGTDNRFYVIDFARVFPPTAERDVKETFLYKLFRPEFVKSYHIPLSSDGFSKFGRHNNKEHNRELTEATKYLLNEIIPNFAKNELIQMYPKNEIIIQDNSCNNTSNITKNNIIIENYIEIPTITEIIHRAGINVRYLGLIRFHTCDYLKPTILNEMCARAIKNRLRKTLRKVTETLTQPQEDLFRQNAINFLNLVLGYDSKDMTSLLFWKKVKKDILKSFGNNSLSDIEKHENFDLRTHIHMYRLFKRVQQLSGVCLTKQAQRDLKKHPGSFQIVQPDINKVAVTVKYMNTISLAEAKALSIASMKQNRSSERLFGLACSKFEKAIQATPDNQQSLNMYADFLINYAIKNPYRSDNIILFNRAFEKYNTTKNYSKLVYLADILRNTKNIEYDDIIIRCYETIASGKINNNINNQKYKSNIWSTAMVNWGDVLVSIARRTNTDNYYEEAGSKYKQSLDDINIHKNLQKLKNIKTLSDIEIAIIFEIYKHNNDFSYFDSDLCYKTRLITLNVLCILVDIFKLKILRLPNCKHLTSSNIISIIKKNSYYTFKEINLKNNTMIDDQCINIIREYCSDSLLSLNLSGCIKITDKGFEHLGKCTQLTNLDISGCKNTLDFIELLSMNFMYIQSLKISRCEIINSPKKKQLLCGLESLSSLKELDISSLPVNNLSCISTCTGLISLNTTSCPIINLNALIPQKGKKTNIERLILCKNKLLESKSLIDLTNISQNLKELDIRGCLQITSNDILTITKNCRKITSFWITGHDKLSNITIKYILNHLQELEHLFMSRLHIEDILNKSSELEFPKGLKSLTIIGGRIKSSVKKLYKCTNLTSLNLSKNKEVTEKHLIEVLKQCRNIKRLELELCIRLSDKIINVISENLYDLEYLNISKGPLYCNINSLIKCKELRILNAEGCKSLMDISDLLSSAFLRELNVKNCVMLSDSLLDAIRENTSLQTIELGGNKISNTNVNIFREAIKNRQDFIFLSPSLRNSTSGSSLAVRVASRSNII